jgi:tetratricopeptide (TPR) repeat protein
MERRTIPSMRARTRIVLVACLLMVGTSAAACSSEPEPPGDQAGEVLRRALQAHGDGDLDAAVDLYKQVLVLDPDNKFAYYNLGLIHQTEGRLGAAAEDYELAIGIDPAFAPALFNLATVRAEEGDLEAAIELYRRVLESNPDNAAAHLNLGFALIDVGEGKDGKAELLIAVELDPALESRIPDELLVVGETTGP